MYDENLDAIPLTPVKEERISHASSYQNNELLGMNMSFSPTPTDFSSVDETPSGQSVARKKIRSARPNSTYIPKNRLSRYTFSTLLPFRLRNTSKAELPVDSIGCFSNTSFFWTRHFILSKADKEKLKHLPTASVPTTDDAFLLPKSTYSDSCEVNGKRLLGIYKDQEQTRGQKRASLFMTCNKFCRTRIIFATLIYMISIFLELFAPVCFLNLVIEHIKETKCIGYLFVFILCYWMAVFLKSMVNWLNLRTAARLRTAIIASVYKKSIKSSISHNIAPHQVLSLANEESEIIFQLVESGMKITGTIVGLILSLVAAIWLLGVPGIWPLFGIFGLFLLGIVMAKVSAYRFRKSLLYAAQKLSIVQDLCINFKTIIILQFDRIYLHKFMDMMTQEHSALVYSKLFASNLSGGLAATILIGGLFLVWLDDAVTTGPRMTLILVIIYGYLMKNIIYTFNESIQSIFNGKACLDKIKNAYSLTSPEISKMRPNSNLTVEINMGVFEWPDVNLDKKKKNVIVKPTKFNLKIEQFYVVKNQIVGIVGSSKSGKTSLLYSILGHTKLLKGLIRIKGKMALLSEQPFMTTESLRNNVLMGQAFDANKYYNSIAAMKLNEDVCVTAGAEELTLGELNLSENQLERIAYARALYSQRDVFLLDEPFKRFEDMQESLTLFKNFIIMLTQSNSTVVLTTDRPEFLEMCQRIYCIDNGEIYREGNYEDIAPVVNNLLLHSHNIRTSEGFDKKIEGCHKDGRNITKMSKVRASTRRINRQSNNGGFQMLRSEEDLTDVNEDDPKISLLSYWSYILLTIIFLLNSAVIYLFPFGMLSRMVTVVPLEGNNNSTITQNQTSSNDLNKREAWLSMISLGAVVVIFVLDIFSKVYLAKVATSISRQYSKIMFHKLLRTSLNSLQCFAISDIVNLFVVDLASAVKSFGVCIEAATSIALAISLLVYGNYWTSIVVGVVLILALLIHFYLRSTLNHWHFFEQKSNDQLSLLLTNTLRGRAIIQSYDKIPEFAKEFYSAIEENTTSIFMQKSIMFHAEFLLNMILTIGFLATGILQIYVKNCDDNHAIYYYVWVMLAYYCFAFELNRFIIEGLIKTITASEKIERLQHNLKKIPRVDDKQAIEAIEDQHGVSVKLRDVHCQISKKDLLKVNKIHIQNGETVGIRGRGGNLIASLFSRIFELSSGDIFIGNKDLAVIEKSNLFSLIAIVLEDPNINNSTIATFLTSQGLFDLTLIKGLIKELKIWENVMNYPCSFDEPLINVSRCDKQLFSLARSILQKPQIIIIEYPHPDAQFIIDSVVQTYFSQKTTIIIGSSDNQFTKCDRVINLDHYK